MTKPTETNKERALTPFELKNKQRDEIVQQITSGSSAVIPLSATIIVGETEREVSINVNQPDMDDLTAINDKAVTYSRIRFDELGADQQDRLLARAFFETMTCEPHPTWVAPFISTAAQKPNFGKMNASQSIYLVALYREWQRIDARFLVLG